MTRTLAVLGIGNMGGAIAESLLHTKFLPAQNLVLFDHSPEKLARFEGKGVVLSKSIAEAISSADTILLCVKPQGIATLLNETKEYFQKNTLLLSIAAGISLKTLGEKSGLEKIVRIMPNTPAQIGMGVSGFFATPAVSSEEYEWVKSLLETFGVAIPCENEDQINAITSLSGSGPAYFFRILEILSEEGKKFGFSEDDASAIALETLRGAGELAKQSRESFPVLRERVTSKGGTTEAALRSFSENHLEEVLGQGIQSAYLRAQELGKEEK